MVLERVTNTMREWSQRKIVKKNLILLHHLQKGRRQSRDRVCSRTASRAVNFSGAYLWRGAFGKECNKIISDFRNDCLVWLGVCFFEKTFFVVHFVRHVFSFGIQFLKKLSISTSACSRRTHFCRFPANYAFQFGDLLKKQFLRKISQSKRNFATVGVFFKKKFRTCAGYCFSSV